MHIPITLILDLQYLYPASLTPTPLRNLLLYYVGMSNDPLVGGLAGVFGSNAHLDWFKSFICVEAYVFWIAHIPPNALITHFHQVLPAPCILPRCARTVQRYFSFSLTNLESTYLSTQVPARYMSFWLFTPPPLRPPLFRVSTPSSRRPKPLRTPSRTGFYL